MPVFQYKAYNADGKELSGNIEASGLREARERLKKDGLYLKELVFQATHEISLIQWQKRVPLDKLATTTHQLSVLLSSGSPLYDALSILTKEEENRTLKNTLIDIKESIAGGSSLSNALEKHPYLFHDMYFRTVEAGEMSGTLDKALAGLAEYLYARVKVNNDVKSALLYPILMTAVGAGVLFFLFIFVIPKITRIFEDTRQAMPFITVILLRITGFLQNYWFFIFISIWGLGWGLQRFIKRPKGKELRDRLFLRIPLIGKVATKFYMAHFARTMGSLLQGNVSILPAIDITKKVLNNHVYENALHMTIREVTEGIPLSVSLKNSGVFPSILVHMIATGEKSGELDTLLLKAASSYERDFEREVNRMLSLLEPMLIITMGAVVGFIVIAILLPIFQLNQAIR